MYAVIETGGKQYRVELGTELAVERLEAEPGASITLDRVLLIADGDATAIGRPLVADASVSAKVLRQDRADKVVVFKYRPKARHRSKRGHRQEQTVLRVTDLLFNGRSAAAEADRSTELKKTERERLEEAARRQAEADAALAAKLAAAEKATAEAAAEVEAAKPARRSRAKATESTTATEAEPKASEPAETPEPAETAETAETAGGAEPAAGADAADAEKPATRRSRAKKTESKDE